MKQSKAAKVNDQHLNGHVSLFKLAKLFDSEASWDKDPTEQTGINNFMVQQLNGIVNEWGWCKQKADEVFSSVQFALCHTMLAQFGFFVMVSDHQGVTLRAFRLPPTLLSHSTPDTPSSIHLPPCPGYALQHQSNLQKGFLWHGVHKSTILFFFCFFSLMLISPQSYSSFAFLALCKALICSLFFLIFCVRI